jgi:Uma2 family endonuclease
MTTASEDVSNREWTIDEYLKLDEGTRYELFDGKLVGMSPPTVAHQYSATRLGTIIDSIAMAYDLGICFDGPLEIALSERTVVQPDLTFFARETPYESVGDRLVAGTPDMIVEVLTPETVARDRGRKRGLYAAFGVEWLLLVDPTSRTAESYRHTGADGYSWRETASGSETLTCPVYPELSIDLAKIWR